MLVTAMHAAPAWDRNTQGDTEAGLENPERGNVRVQLDAGRPPVTAGPARVGFQGIRKNLERIVATIMPGVPKGPPIIIANRARPDGAGRAAVMPIRAAVVPVALVSSEQTAPWYEHLS